MNHDRLELHTSVGILSELVVSVCAEKPVARWFRGQGLSAGCANILPSPSYQCVPRNEQGWETASGLKGVLW